MNLGGVALGGLICILRLRGGDLGGVAGGGVAAIGLARLFLSIPGNLTFILFCLALFLLGAGLFVHFSTLLS